MTWKGFGPTCHPPQGKRHAGECGHEGKERELGQGRLLAADGQPLPRGFWAVVAVQHRQQRQAQKVEQQLGASWATQCTG